MMGNTHWYEIITGGSNWTIRFFTAGARAPHSSKGCVLGWAKRIEQFYKVFCSWCEGMPTAAKAMYWVGQQGLSVWSKRLTRASISQ
eukprot:scaffold38643_cov20-Tisochrysis_lutea.AAC.3